MLADTQASEAEGRVPSSGYAPDRFPRTTAQAGLSPEFPSPPAMPHAVVLLELLLASNVADLDAVAGLIRNDVGLTVELLRLAYGAPSRHRALVVSVCELAVDLGLERLRAMAAGTTLFSCQAAGKAAFQAWQQFSRRAQRTARIAAELAGGASVPIRETAYIAGLLCQVGRVPRLLGWPLPGIEAADPGELGFQMTKSWNFPALLVEVIRGDEQACTSTQARDLLRLINAARRRALTASIVTPAKAANQAQSMLPRKESSAGRSS